MTTKRLKRPRDPPQLAKLIGDIATGQIEDRAYARGTGEKSCGGNSWARWRH